MKQYASFRKMQAEEIKSKSQELEVHNKVIGEQKSEKEKLIEENEKERKELEKEKQEQEKIANQIKKDKGNPTVSEPRITEETDKRTTDNI